MQRHFYKALLGSLRVLVYLKRFVFWVFGFFWEAVLWLTGIYQRTIGFRLYKLWFLVKKQLIKWKIPLDGRLLEFFGRRGTLQTAAFFIGLFLVTPYSHLTTQEVGKIPGRDTLLFALAGPGDADFEFEAVEAGFAEFGQHSAQTWRQGTLSTDSAVPGTNIQPGFAQQGISRISVGGSAVTKPTIITGAVPLSDQIPHAGPTHRTETVQYIVKPGDVIGKIATEFGVSIETILWANNLSLRSYIRPGDTLKILPVSGLLHTVKRGDTISKIAQLYDADQQQIIEFNKLQEGGSDIVIGEELIIPNGRKPYTAPAKPAPPVASAFRSVSAPPPSVTAPAGSGYLWPTSVRHISQYFGWRHTGLDIAGPKGSAIYAARAGKVIKSQCGWNGGYGCYIIIDHGGGVHTLYGHESELYVSVGDDVVQGQTIGAMGSTGRSTGPHVHFEVRINGVRQNPLKYIK